MSGLLCNKINHIFFVHFSYKGMLPPFFAQIAMNYLREGIRKNQTGDKSSLDVVGWRQTHFMVQVLSILYVLYI